MIIHQASFRLVGTVDAAAVVQELTESSMEDIVDFIQETVAHSPYGPDLKAAVIAALNQMEWESIELDEEEEEV